MPVKKQDLIKQDPTCLMCFFKANLLAAFVLFLAPTLTILSAAEKTDLERITPVAANEVIPIGDFFRPSLFSHPTLNPSGTKLAALVETGDDSTAMQVFDLRKMQSHVLKGRGNHEIDSFAWLDQDHLLSSMISEKHIAEGVFVTNAADMSDHYAILTSSVTKLIGVPRETPMKPLLWIYRNAYDDDNDFGVVQIDATKRLGENRDAPPETMQGKQYREETSLYGVHASIMSNFAVPPREGVVIDYMADKDGHLAFAITAKKGIFSLFRFVNKKWEPCPATSM